MLNLQTYKKSLMVHGNNLSELKRNQSDFNINQSFTGDPAYKRVYILTKEGWKWEDAKYQFHSSQTLDKDPVDYYLQFRPKIHYPVGSYVIVPDDTGSVNLTDRELENPFLQPVNERTQWWIIVDRNNAKDYVRYLILKCDWEFKWIYKNRILSCWGCARTAKSYTSGVWRDLYSQSPDNLTQFWLPDTHYVYGEFLETLGLSDTRTIMHLQRFFISNNDLDPKIYQTTKIIDLAPQGIIKITAKQDELNRKLDNTELHICNYYNDNGEPKVKPSEPYYDYLTRSEIRCMIVNAAGELETDPAVYGPVLLKKLHIGISSYFQVKFPENHGKPFWDINLLQDENYSEEINLYCKKLIKISNYDDFIISVKLSKAKSLLGKHFILSVCDENGDYCSSIELEVSDET